jgi:probable HAF family extracellular repeat protein
MILVAAQLATLKGRFNIMCMQRCLGVAFSLVTLVMAMGPLQVNAGDSGSFVILDPYGPSDINDHGSIVGSYADAVTGQPYAFLMVDDIVTTINSPACPVPSRHHPGIAAWGVNNQDQVVGGYHPCGGGDDGHGFLWADGVLQTVDVPNEPNTEWYSINDHGEMVGSYNTTGLHGVFFSKGTFTELVAPDREDLPIPFGLNNRGDLVGNIGGDAFLWSKGQYTYLRVPGSGETEARGINDEGQIVGFWLDDTLSIHGFVFANGTFTEVTVPGGSMVELWGINNAGQVVGSYTDEAGLPHGFTMSIGRSEH